MTVEAVCLASGPSLTLEDVEKVRDWRRPGRIVIVANTTFRIAPWADVLFCMDNRWWDVHIEEIRSVFAGELITASQAYVTHGLVFAPARWKFNHYGNSGAGAINVARLMGAKRIVLLGYDGKKTGGKCHWHGPHPDGLGNAGTARSWPMQFKRVSKEMKKIDIVNASRETVLKCFPRIDLDRALEASEAERV